MQPEPTHPSQNGRFHIRRAEHVREYDQPFECLQIRAAVPYEYKTRQNLALVCSGRTAYLLEKVPAIRGV